MKRKGNLFQKIISVDNLIEADKKAQKGKLKQHGVKSHNKNKKENTLNLHKLLKSKIYKTSEYKTFKIFEPKERKIYQLPYYPDRIVHHAVMNIMTDFQEHPFTWGFSQGMN